jgi:hypothetical protein
VHRHSKSRVHLLAVKLTIVTQIFAYFTCIFSSYHHQSSVSQKVNGEHFTEYASRRWSSTVKNYVTLNPQQRASFSNAVPHWVINGAKTDTVSRITYLSVGWPFRSCDGATIDSPQGTRENRFMIEYHSTNRYYFPFHLRPSGLFGNVLASYTIFIGMILMYNTLRSNVLASKSRCTNCGYITINCTVCPECGKYVVKRVLTGDSSG